MIFEACALPYWELEWRELARPYVAVGTLLYMLLHRRRVRDLEVEIDRDMVLRLAIDIHLSDTG